MAQVSFSCCSPCWPGLCDATQFGTGACKLVFTESGAGHSGVEARRLVLHGDIVPKMDSLKIIKNTIHVILLYLEKKSIDFIHRSLWMASHGAFSYYFI